MQYKIAKQHFYENLDHYLAELEAYPSSNPLVEHFLGRENAVDYVAFTNRYTP